MISALTMVPITANAALIPTPAPGSATLLTAPSPNPVQYNAVNGAVIASGQVNSTNYKVYNDINAIIAALNGCSYAPGSAIVNVSYTAPITASLGSCSPGSGITLTLGFSAVGQTLNVGSLNASGGVTGGNSSFAAIGVSSITNTGAYAGTTGSFTAIGVSSITNTGAYAGTTGSFTAIGVSSISNTGGYSGTTGSFSGLLNMLDASTSTKLISTSSGSGRTYPYDIASSGTSNNNHIDRGTVNVGTLAGGCSGSGVTFTGSGFTSAPIVTTSLDGATLGYVAYVANRTNTNMTIGICNSTASSPTLTVDWIAIGQ